MATAEVRNVQVRLTARFAEAEIWNDAGKSFLRVRDEHGNVVIDSIEVEGSGFGGFLDANGTSRVTLRLEVQRLIVPIEERLLLPDGENDGPSRVDVISLSD